MDAPITVPSRVDTQQVAGDAVNPDEFVLAMVEHWTRTLRNVPSDNLRSLWRTMATTFGNAISDFDSPRPVWRILNPPTGTGKSQGTAVYCALMSRAAKPKGVLIVTRLISEADEMVSRINGLSGKVIAIAKHSEAPVAPHEAAKHLVLVVTHAAYVKALEGFEEGSRWSDMTDWEGGKRRLTIIDESLSNVVESHHLTEEDLRRVFQYITPSIRREFHNAVLALETLQTVLGRIAEIVQAPQGDAGGSAGKPKGTAGGADGDTASRIVWRKPYDQEVAVPDEVGLDGLRLHMAGLRFDHMALRKESPLDRRRLAGIVDKTLADAQAILTRWTYYAKVGLEHSFNSSYLLIPENLPAPVVLDATATQQVLWELLENRAVIQPIPQGTRSYANVTLHRAPARALGKGKMKETARVRIPRVLKDLEDRLGPDRAVLFVCHKDVEHLALSFCPRFSRFSVAHYGAIDGRNDWHDFDTVVVFGLPYRDHIWSTNVFFALQGLQDDAWLQSPKWKHYADVRREMQVKQLTTSVIQAINRIRCRRVVDANGNCPRADVFIALPDTVEGDSILQNLKCEMPGIDVRPWDFAMDGDAVQVRRGSSHAALIAFMANRLPGETPMTQVRKELGLSPDGLASLRRALRDPTHALSKTLAAIGVRYASNGAGRGSRSQLIKASLLDLSPRLFGGEKQAPSAESFGFTAEKATA